MMCPEIIDTTLMSFDVGQDFYQAVVKRRSPRANVFLREDCGFQWEAFTCRTGVPSRVSSPAWPASCQFHPSGKAF